MRVLFIPDCADSIGFGHVSRSLVLAHAMREAGHEALFLIQNYERAKDFITSSGFFAKTFSSESYVAKVKARTLLESLGRLNVDLAVTDQRYNADNLLSKIRDRLGFLVAIDDFGKALKSPDVIINGQVFARHSLYEKRPGQLLLTGPPYALIGEPILSVRNKVRVRKTCRKITVSLGGSDRSGLLPCLIDVFKKIEGNLSFNIIVGPSVGDTQKLCESAQQDPRIAIKNFMTNGFAKELCDTDLVFCSGITTVTECLFLGIPTIMVPQIYHQLKTGKGLRDMGCTVLLQRLKKRKPKYVARQVEDIINGYETRRRLGETGRRLFLDKRSPKKIVDEIFLHYRKIIEHE